MNIRDEIRLSRRGTISRLSEATGLSRVTIYRATRGIKCSVRTAKAISRAFGHPDRWSEFFDDDPAHPDQGPTVAA